MLLPRRIMRSLLLLAAVLMGSVTARAANTSCGFDTNTLAFPGTPFEQARCLLRPIKPHGELAAPLATLPAPLESLIGQPVKLDIAAIQKYLSAHGIAEDVIGGPLTNHCGAKYFVIHDTSTPNYGSNAIPTNINTAAWSLNNLNRYTNRPVAHIFVNRLGESITLRIQDRFVPEPVFAKTGRGYLKSEGVATLHKIKTSVRHRASAKAR